MPAACSSGKTRHTSIRRAKAAAHAFARELNREGRLSENLYAYPHDECHGWHLTRKAEWQGNANTPVFIAPPTPLQHWAMSGDEATVEVWDITEQAWRRADGFLPGVNYTTRIVRVTPIPGFTEAQ